MKRLSIAFAFIALTAAAGGPAWEVKVKSIHFDAKTATIELVNVSDIYKPYQACNPLKIVTKYEGEPWYLLSNTWSKNVSADDHEVALNFLKKAMIDSTVISFAYVGSGIVPIDKRNLCIVRSRGLIQDGINVVSFHDPI